jgi:hypothetical protein
VVIDRGEVQVCLFDNDDLDKLIEALLVARVVTKRLHDEVWSD